MTVTFESNEYQCQNTHPSIPYSIYVAETYLLLVPRTVEKLHRNFPTTPVPAKQFKLQLSDKMASEYKTKFNREPKFNYKNVGFGLEDDEVVVTSLIDCGWIPHWEIRTLMSGENDGKGHFTDMSSDPKAIYEIMKWDLLQANPRP